MKSSWSSTDTTPDMASAYPISCVWRRVISGRRREENRERGGAKGEHTYLEVEPATLYGGVGEEDWTAKHVSAKPATALAPRTKRDVEPGVAGRNACQRV